jgi:hypothetical protein
MGERHPGRLVDRRGTVGVGAGRGHGLHDRAGSRQVAVGDPLDVQRRVSVESTGSTGATAGAASFDGSTKR